MKAVRLHEGQVNIVPEAGIREFTGCVNPVAIYDQQTRWPHLAQCLAPGGPLQRIKVEDEELAIKFRGGKLGFMGGLLTGIGGAC